MVDPTDVQMAVQFCLRLQVDTEKAPPLPWSTRRDWLMDANDEHIAKMMRPTDGQLIAGMMTGASHVNSTLHRLARLMVDAAKEGPDSNSGRRLRSIVNGLMVMEAEGNLPKLG